MTQALPSHRFIHYYDGGLGLGINLTGTPRQMLGWDPPQVDTALQDLTGSQDDYPEIFPPGYESSPDLTLPLVGNSTLQEVLDDIHGVTRTDRQSQRILVVGWRGGSATGQYADVALAYLKNVRPKTPSALVTTVETVWGIDRVAYTSCYILHGLQARTADGDTKASAFNHGSLTSLGGIAFFGCTGYTAGTATGLAPRVIDSPDGITYGALATFTPTTSATGTGEYIDVTGDVEQYVAADWDFTGTPNGATTATFEILFKRFV